MPGINLIIDKKSILIRLNKQRIKEAESKTIINERYGMKNIIESDNIYLSVLKYEEYPFAKFQYGDVKIFLEGKIYLNENEKLEERLNQLSDILFSDKSEADEKISSWLRENDGDYIIVFYREKDNSLRVVNDLLGRLPFYYFENDGLIILSRKIEFISVLTGETVFNKIAISFYLLLGYIPSLDTLFANIFRFPPASVLNFNGRIWSINRLYRFNVENKFNSGNSPTENARMLTEIFVRATLNRLDKEKENVVTLSGGIDSRAVASALVREKINFKAATLLHHDNGGMEDAKVAEQLAGIYKVDWKLFKLSPPAGRHLTTLLAIKDGMNSLAVSAFMPFLETLLENYGNKINVFTGDNGDKLILTYDKPIKKLRSDEELIDYIILENRLIQPEIVEKLTGISSDEIKQKMFDVLKGFPENDFRQKYIHFRMIEKPFKYSFEGEDRNRSFFWSVSPFWNPEFIIQTMGIPENQKKGHRIFAAFLMNLHKESSKLKDVNLKVPITSLYGKTVLFLINDVYPNMPNGLRRYIKSKYFVGNPTIDTNSPVYKNILRQLKTTEELKEYLYISEGEKLKSLKKAEIENLFTITSLIEKYAAGKSILKNENKTEFV